MNNGEQIHSGLFSQINAEKGEKIIMEKQEKSDGVKIIFVGNSGVGKTTLLGSMLKHSFNENVQSTIYPAFYTQTYTKTDGGKIELQLWDTAGQEKYHAVSQLFFRNSNIAVVCFAAGDQESMSAVHEWVRMVKNEEIDCFLLFVATKSDLLEKEDFENVIGDAEAELQQYENANFFLTSSKTGYNIDNVFKALCELSEFGESSSHKPMDVSKSFRSCC